MQRYTTVFITLNALHVSGGSSAHHQEIKTVHTAWGICRAFTASYRLRVIHFCRAVEQMKRITWLVININSQQLIMLIITVIYLFFVQVPHQLLSYWEMCT